MLLASIIVDIIVVIIINAIIILIWLSLLPSRSRGNVDLLQSSANAFSAGLELSMLLLFQVGFDAVDTRVTARPCHPRLLYRRFVFRSLTVRNAIPAHLNHR